MPSKIVYKGTQLNQTTKFFQNILNLVRAIKLIFSHPVYLIYILIAVIINIVIFILMIIFLVWVFNLLGIYIQNYFNLDDITQFLKTSLQILIFVISIVISAILYPTLSTIINSIIYDSLSERVLKDHKIYPKSNKNFIVTTADSLGFEGKKILVAIILFLITLLLNIVPVIGNVISIILSYANIILLNGLDTMNAPLSTQEIKFREKIQFVTKNPSTWGYLFITATMNGIPILNIFTIPLTIISSSLVYKDIAVQREST